MNIGAIVELLEVTFGNAIPRVEYPRLVRFIESVARMTGGAPLAPAPSNGAYSSVTHQIQSYAPPPPAAAPRTGKRTPSAEHARRIAEELIRHGPLTLPELAKRLGVRKATNLEVPAKGLPRAHFTGLRGRPTRLFGPPTMAKSELETFARQREGSK